MAEDFAVFAQNLAVPGLNGKVAGLPPVGLHIKELLPVLALVVEDIFVTQGTDHPAKRSGSLEEIRLGHYAFTGGLLIQKLSDAYSAPAQSQTDGIRSIPSFTRISDILAYFERST